MVEVSNELRSFSGIFSKQIKRKSYRNFTVSIIQTPGVVNSTMTNSPTVENKLARNQEGNTYGGLDYCIFQTDEF